MKQISYWGSTRHHHKKFSCHGYLVPCGICAPLA